MTGYLEIRVCTLEEVCEINEVKQFSSRSCVENLLIILIHYSMNCISPMLGRKTLQLLARECRSHFGGNEKETSNSPIRFYLRPRLQYFS